LGDRGPGRGRRLGTSRRKPRFVTAFRYLKTRIGVFTALPLKSLDKIALGTKLREVGQSEGVDIASPERRVRCIMDVIIYHNPDCGTSRQHVWR